jgi:peroxiredoxin
VPGRSFAASAAGAAVGALLVVAGWFGAAPGHAQGAASTTAPPAALPSGAASSGASAKAPAVPAPDFALRAAAGPNVRLSEFRGDVVVLTFWSSRCNVCREQLSALDRAYGTFRPAGFTVLGVSVDDDVAAARNFALAQRVTFPMRHPLLLDSSKDVARAFRVDALPMMVAIDRFGMVRFVLHARRSDQARDYVSEIRKLIDE